MQRPSSVLFFSPAAHDQELPQNPVLAIFSNCSLSLSSYQIQFYLTRCTPSQTKLLTCSLTNLFTEIILLFLTSLRPSSLPLSRRLLLGNKRLNATVSKPVFGRIRRYCEVGGCLVCVKFLIGRESAPGPAGPWAP